MNEAQFQRLIRERPDLARFFHYVRAGKDGRRGYYKRRPITYSDRSARPASQLRSQLAFAESARGAFGKRGFKNGVPVVAATVGKNQRGRKFKKAPWEQAIDKLREALMTIGKVMEEKVSA